MVDFLYHELDPQQVDTFQAHLTGCPRCSEELASLSKTCGVLRELPRLDPPALISQRLIQAARDEVDRGSFWSRLLDSLRFMVVHPAMTAAVTLLLVVGVSFYAYRNGPLPDRQASTDTELPEVKLEGAPASIGAGETLTRDEPRKGPSGELVAARSTEKGRQLDRTDTAQNGLASGWRDGDDKTAGRTTGERTRGKAHPTRRESRWAQTEVPLARQAGGGGKAEQQAPQDNRRHIGTRGLWKTGISSGQVARNEPAPAAEPQPTMRPKRSRPAPKLPPPVAQASKAKPSTVAANSQSDDADSVNRDLTLADEATSAGRCSLALGYYNRVLKARPALLKQLVPAVRPCVEQVAHGGETALRKAQKSFPMLASQLQVRIDQLRVARRRAAPAKKKVLKAVPSNPTSTQNKSGL